MVHAKDCQSDNELFVLSGALTTDRRIISGLQVGADLIKKAVSWAEEHAALIARSGKPLDAAMINVARRVGVCQPERVRISSVDAMPIPEDPELRQFALEIGFLSPNIVGLTLDHGIYVREGYATRKVLSHELRHVHQYEMAGSIENFITAYFKQIAEFGYRDAPFEQDARAHEKVI
jgi:hypothetical protein